MKDEPLTDFWPVAIDSKNLRRSELERWSLVPRLFSECAQSILLMNILETLRNRRCGTAKRIHGS